MLLTNGFGMTQSTRCSCLIMGLGLLTLPLSQLEAAVIHLRQSVAVSDPVVRLGHIARIEHPDSQTAQRLRGLPLAPAPLNGRTITIKAARVSDHLAAVGLKVDRIQFAGTHSTLVSRRQQSPHKSDRPQTPSFVSPRLRKARTVIGRAIELRLQQKSLNWMLIHDSLLLPDTLVTELLSADPRTIEIAGGRLPLDAIQTLQISYHGVDGQFRTTTINCRLCPATTVWKMGASVRRGQPISRSDLVPEHKQSGTGRIVDVNQVVGQIATRTLHPGAQLKPSDVRKAKLIKTGDLVTVTSQVGGISVQTEMKARSTGSSGESVTLETLDRRTRIRAVVTGQRTAEIPPQRNPELSGLRVLQTPNTAALADQPSPSTRTARSATRTLRTTQTSQSRFQKGFQK